MSELGKWKLTKADRPCEGMNIAGVAGLTEAQTRTLRALGAIAEQSDRTRFDRLHPHPALPNFTS
ncbi:MAG: hypothetical protein HC895_08635 [Leptolyngbyaceae cyanobacterium SM1_3_5]|nr:hypothetical protein [Leptolyngbyaceae cyanobacterium SM1_3_5]